MGDSVRPSRITRSILATTSGRSRATSFDSATSSRRLYSSTGAAGFRFTPARTPFQSPIRTACNPCRAGDSQYIVSCRFCSASRPSSVGAKLIPSIFSPSGSFAPATSANVGITSQNAQAWSDVTPAATFAGQRAMKGTRIPPSYKLPFRPRRGPALSKNAASAPPA